MGCRTDKHLFIFVELRVLSRVWILQCIHFTHNLTLLIVDLYFMHCWSSLRILVYICIETDFWFYRSAAHLDSTVIYDGCDLGDSRIRPDQCASRRPEESTGAHFGSGHSLPHFDTILCNTRCNEFTAFPTGIAATFLLSSYVQLNSPVKLSVLRWIRRSRQQWIWRCKENSSTRPSIPSYIQTFAAPMRGFWTLGANHLVFADFLCMSY